MSRGQSHPQLQSRKRTLGKFKKKGTTDSAVFIDVDNEELCKVIILDAPESSHQALQGSRVSRVEGIITIDDEGSGGAGNPGNDVESGGDLHSDATSSVASHPASSQLPISEESDDDECQFVWERTFPFKISKCKRTYSGNISSRNCFGLDSASECSSSESDGSDCELMEGSVGKIREQWEKAYSRKKMLDDTSNGQSGLENQASASGSHFDTEKMAEHTEVSVGSSSRKASDDKENLSTSTTTGDAILGGTSGRPSGGNPFADLSQNVEQGSPLSFKSQPWEEAQFPRRKADTRDRGNTYPGDPLFCHTKWPSETQEKEQFCGEPSVQSTKKQVDEQFLNAEACFQEKDGNIPAHPCLFNTQSEYGKNFNFAESSFQAEETSSGHSQQSNEMEVDCYGAFDYEVHHEHSSCNNQSLNDTEYKGANFEDKEKLVSGEPSFCNTQTQVNHGLGCPNDRYGSVLRETYDFNPQPCNETEADHDRATSQTKDKPLSEESSLYNTVHVETQPNNGIASYKEGEDPILVSVSGIHQQDKINPLLHCQDKISESDVQNDLIGDREKLKTTEEYKRAVEEEWASRRRQLQIQADEAHRLRKRRKAETLRLVDMERRQKERVEEMRELQKKDEETINLKEQIRVEIRKELEKLEMMYNNMASLLCALGIQVGGGFYPTSREVHAAYKQALLKFHPDRASRNDIRQLVEAEEKFKLISRLKDKLLPA